MTKKADLKKELLEKVKLGTKPSDIRRLKRSKSESDIANIPPPPPLPPNHLLTDQLKEKQWELENLRKESETKSTTIRLLRESLDRDNKEQEITELKKELVQVKKQLDNSLEARTNSLTDFAKQYEKTKKLAQELEQTIEEASRELNHGDQEISQLRTKLFQATQQANNLQRELNLTRINRKSLPFKWSSPELQTADNFLTNLNYFQYGLYALMAVWFVLLLTNTKKYKQND